MSVPSNCKLNVRSNNTLYENPTTAKKENQQCSMATVRKLFRSEYNIKAKKFYDKR